METQMTGIDETAQQELTDEELDVLIKANRIQLDFLTQLLNRV